MQPRFFDVAQSKQIASPITSRIQGVASRFQEALGYKTGAFELRLFGLIGFRRD